MTAAMAELYDVIGIDYHRLRRPDPRIAAHVDQALGAARSVLTVGAGAGAYEPRDRRVVAVEPSRPMIRQRPPDAAPVVQATGTALPVRDAAFDAALAVLTLHHWPDQARGVRELARAARRVVILTWDPYFENCVDPDGGLIASNNCHMSRSGPSVHPDHGPRFWLLDYLPEILAADRRIFPSLDWYAPILGGRTSVTTVPIPHDCTDGFLGAYWRRPAAYLDPTARSAISSMAKLDDVESGLARLRRDLDSGVWQQRHATLLGQSSLDLGYRLIVADRDG
jgi:SAM-dependent methyltransferase